MLAYGYYPFGIFWDPTYILIIIAMLLSLVASAMVKTTFGKYAKVRSFTNMTGAQAAERLLHHQGIYDVRIGHISGDLTDHYDPRNKVLNLSDSTYGSTSVAAIGVAAHECGHAIQHAKGYAPLTIRGALVPAANIGSSISWPLIILGIILGANQTLITIGILCFSLAVLFQIVTLPVEFDASARALKLLESDGILQQGEVKQTRKVLTAAAMTYVAGTAGAILQLLRLILLFGDRRND